MRPSGICMKPSFKNLGLGTFPISQVDLQKFDFWDHQCPPAILDLVQHRKDTTLPVFHKSRYLEIRSGYRDHEVLCTDGSEDEERACAAVYTNAEMMV